MLVLFGGKKKNYSEMSAKKEEAVRLSRAIASVLYKIEEILSQSQLGSNELSL